MKDKRLGTIIREARKRENLTLRKASELIGISNPYLSQLENGHTHKPNSYTLRRMAYVLDIPFTELAHYSETELGHGIDEKYRSLARKLPIDVYNHLESYDTFIKFFKKTTQNEEYEDLKYIDDDSLMRIYSFLTYVVRVAQTLWKDFEDGLVGKLVNSVNSTLSLMDININQFTKGSNEALDLLSLISSDVEISIHEKTLTPSQKDKAKRILEIVFE